MRNFSFRKFISDTLFISIILLLLLRMFSDTPMPFSTILSDSMAPTLNRGDIVLVLPCTASNVRVGDIVVFRYGDKYVAHRAIAIVERNGEISLVTKGDNNEYPDQYGPHSPLPYVTKENLIGVVVTIFGVPIKIPYIGLIIKHLNYLKFPYIAPFAIALILFMSILTIESKHRTISLAKILIVSFLIFTILTFTQMVFARHVFVEKVGVGTYAGSDALNYLAAGDKLSMNITLTNPGFTPIKCILSAENASVEKEVFIINPGTTLKKDVVLRLPEKKGIYNISVIVHYSPFWMIIPDSIVNILPHNIYSILILNLISSLVLSILTVLIIFIVNIFLEFVSIKMILMNLGRKKKHEIGIIEAKRVHAAAILSSLIGIMISYSLGISFGILAMLVALPMLSYILGLRWSSQYLFAGVEASLCFIMYYTIPFMLFRIGLWTSILAIASTLLFVSLFGPLISVTALLLGKTISRIRSIKNPFVIFEGDL